MTTSRGHGISELPFDYDGSSRTNCTFGIPKGNQPADRVDSSMRLRQLRSEMVRITSVQGPPLDGYIVTSDDAHQVRIWKFTIFSPTTLFS